MAGGMKIEITNCTGTRNRGCEALVQCLVDGLRARLGPPEPDIGLHTNDPLYDAHSIRGLDRIYFSYPTNTPNHFSSFSLNRAIYQLARCGEHVLPARLRGISTRTLSASFAADCILPTGGDLFTSDYGHLRKQFAYCHDRAKVVLLGHTIGPFSTADEKYFIRGARRFAGISVRERESYDYIRSLKLDIPIRLSADLAFLLEPADGDRCRTLFDNILHAVDRPVVGISVSQGIIRYASLRQKDYYGIFAAFVDELHRRGKQVLLIPHVQERNPNNDDWFACHEVWRRVADKRTCTIASGQFRAAEYKGLIGLCECLVGTRTHPTIASIAQRVPTVGVAYSRKAGSIFKDVFGDGVARQLIVDATELSADALLEAYAFALSHRAEPGRVSAMKRRAEDNFSFFEEVMTHGA